MFIAGLAGVITTNPTLAEEISLGRDDMVLDRSVVVKAGVYPIPDPGDDGAVRIAGDGITVDFQGAEFVGCADGVDADAYSGRGIVIRGRNINLKNAKVRGYSHGVYGRGQDSAGILVYEQRTDNVFAYNSATLSPNDSADGYDQPADLARATSQVVGPVGRFRVARVSPDRSPSAANLTVF